jgi:ferredoxin
MAADDIIDFHSGEFNRRDDLNDYSGNYRSFLPLDGVVTADMRHQVERRHDRDMIDSCVDDTAPVKKIETIRDTAEAIEAAPPLTVISHGRTLIIDTDAERAIVCGKLLSDHGLTCTLLAIKKGPPDASYSKLGSLALLEVNAASITGAFGGFSATVTINGNQRDLTEWFDNKTITFDLVLDLQSIPSFAGDSLPMGYYAPGPDPVKFNEAMMELPEMRGRFNKPQFTIFRENHCIHGRSRTRDCRQCLTVCPFGAIQSINRKVSINHYLCQGCGGCALVCPADAIRMIQPSQRELLDMLWSRLENRSAGAGVPPTLVISGMETLDRNDMAGMNEIMDDGAVHLEVEQIGHASLEILLTALTCGAGKVVVACGPQDPPTIRKAVEWQTRMAGAILRGLGISEEKIRVALVPAENSDTSKAFFKVTDLNAQHAFSPVPPPALSLSHDKRTLIRLATQHLYDQSSVQQPWLPLPAGSPFGAVTVHSAACTLCMACAAACPSGALFASGDVPRLEFIESRCHQCGLCEETCPEGAIQLLPRMLCSPHAVEMPMVVNEAEPFRCVECGVPFATQAMIDRMEAKLKGHWMYADDRQLRRLRMCVACRAGDALASEDIKSWNQH